MYLAGTGSAYYVSATTSITGVLIFIISISCLYFVTVVGAEVYGKFRAIQLAAEDRRAAANATSLRRRKTADKGGGGVGGDSRSLELTGKPIGKTDNTLNPMFLKADGAGNAAGPGADNKARVGSGLCGGVPALPCLAVLCCTHSVHASLPPSSNHTLPRCCHCCRRTMRSWPRRSLRRPSCGLSSARPMAPCTNRRKRQRRH
jgi:hypothetical protein